MPTYAELSDIVERVQDKACILEEETAFKLEKLHRIAAKCATKHNPSYVLSGTSSTVPDRETECVVILMCAEVILMRAVMLAAQPNGQSNGFSTEYRTPFDKCMSLYKLFTDVLYPKECELAGVPARSEGVSTSELITQLPREGIKSNPILAPYPPTPFLSAPEFKDSNTAAVFSLQCTPFSDLANVTVYMMQDTVAPELVQDWNFSSKVAPTINENATVIGLSSLVRSFKLTGLVSTKHIAVIVGVTNRNGKHSFSNVITAQVP